MSDEHTRPESTDERIRREQEFHDARIEEADTARQKVDKYYVLMQRARDEYTQMAIAYGRDHDLLDYGCFNGDAAFVWSSEGARTTGIDISPAAVDIARKRAAERKHTMEQERDVRFEVMNAEEMDFPSGSFDVAAGTGILHHLDLHRGAAELARVLRADGHALFIEPMGHNPAINLYRKLTPGLRSEDEHPLRMRDLDVFAQYFHSVDVRFYNLFTFLSLPLRGGALFKPVNGFLHAIDRALFTLLPFTRRYAWLTLIHLSNPRK